MSKKSHPAGRRDGRRGTPMQNIHPRGEKKRIAVVEVREVSGKLP